MYHRCRAKNEKAGAVDLVVATGAVAGVEAAFAAHVGGVAKCTTYASS